MQLEKIPLRDTHSFSSFFLDYISEAAPLKPFYGHTPHLVSFEAQLALKASFPEASRKILVDVLQRQYSSLTQTDRTRENIAALAKPLTFTVTTGHQLNIFTGPLYFINKIVTVINICLELKKKHPQHTFVPVYWMASEDHDFEEISFFRLNGTRHTWKTTQTGAVGRFNPGSLSDLLNELPGDTSIFREAYLQNTSLSNAARSYVNALFGDEGIVVIDADDHRLKNQLREVMIADLFDHIPRKKADEETAKLKGLGYHTQVNARDVNFFFLDAGVRNRIEKDTDGFHVVDQDIRHSDSEIRALVDREPEKLSPNVILRPLYQEIILPNLAYVGGPSELVYWLQLKSIFDHFHVPFPILMPRNFSMVMDVPVTRTFRKTGLTITDLFQEKNVLFNNWTRAHSTHDLSLEGAQENIKSTFGTIRLRASAIDPTLTAHVSAKEKQVLDNLEIIGRKMVRAEKRKLSDALRHVEAVKDQLFPGGSLQERTDNFLTFYQTNPHFIGDLLQALDPFDYRMHVLMYHD